MLDLGLADALCPRSDPYAITEKTKSRSQTTARDLTDVPPARSRRRVSIRYFRFLAVFFFAAFLAGAFFADFLAFAFFAMVAS